MSDQYSENSPLNLDITNVSLEEWMQAQRMVKVCAQTLMILVMKRVWHKEMLEGLRNCLTEILDHSL